MSSSTEPFHTYFNAATREDFFVSVAEKNTSNYFKGTKKGTCVQKKFCIHLIATLLPSMTMCLSGARSRGWSGSTGNGGDRARGGCCAASLMSSANKSFRGGSDPNLCSAVRASRSEYPNFTANSIFACERDICYVL